MIEWHWKKLSKVWQWVKWDFVNNKTQQTMIQANIETGNVEDFGTLETNILNTRHAGMDVAFPPPSDPPLRVQTEKEPAQETTGHKQYAMMGDVYTPCGETRPRLQAGVYDINRSEQGYFYVPHIIHSDAWLAFRDDLIVNVLNEIETFWNSEALFKKYGFLQRRGYMFYGPPGCGKSVLFKQIIHKLVESDGVIFYANYPDALVDGLKVFRKIEPDRRVVVIFEDVDAIISRYGDSSLLSYLDGEDSCNKILNLFSSNYPERLDKRLVNRPCRIDRLIHIGYPDERMRSHFFSEKLKIEGSELKEWVSLTDDFPFAALTELVISVKCLGNKLDDSVKILRKHMGTKLDSENFDGTRKVGFSGQ